MCLMLNRPLILEYGLWDEIRVDQGKEWVLSLFVQEQMAHLRTNTARPPHLQSTSKKVFCCNYVHCWHHRPLHSLLDRCIICTYTLTFQNYKIEQFWVEINKRLNYPLKIVLVEMENNLCMHQSTRPKWQHTLLLCFMDYPESGYSGDNIGSAWNEDPIPCEISSGNVIKHKHSTHIHVQCFIQCHASM